MEQLQECPVCGGHNFTYYLKAKDYLISGETFTLEKCQTCDLIATTPRPANDLLPRYYESPNYISHNNEPKSLFDKTYGLARKLALDRKWKLIQRLTTADHISILDLGCGTGTFLQYCKQKGATISGVEPSKSAREIASHQTGSTIFSSIHDIKGSFTTVTMWHVLEHVPDLNETLQAISERLNANGSLIIAVPNINSRDAQHYGNRWAALDVPRHLWHFSPQTMDKLLSKNNLRVKQIHPMKMDAYYVALLTEKYKRQGFTVSGLITATYRGLVSNLSASEKEYSSLIYVVTK